MSSVSMPSSHTLIDASPTPVAVFAYNRPQHVARALEALARCARKNECCFHFFLDGAKTPEDAPAVASTLQVLESFQPKFDARLIIRAVNLGLAKSIVGGVSDLVASYGRIIVLEDDLLVQPDFLHYMIESLNHYADTPSVMQVAALSLRPPAACETDVYLLPITSTWGWATWARAWTHFSWTPVDLEAQQEDSVWQNRFNANGSFDGNSMLADRLSGKNNSWGILWWYAVSRQNGLVAYPRHSLVQNTGFDGSGTHCGTGNPYEQSLADSDRNLPGKLSFPADNRYEPGHMAVLENYFGSLAVPPARPKQSKGLLGRLTQFFLNVARR